MGGGHRAIWLNQAKMDRVQPPYDMQLEHDALSSLLERLSLQAVSSMAKARNTTAC